MNKTQAVILCAGKGSRLFPLTKEVPKVLIKVHNKTLLEYKLDLLQDLVDEVILVIGHLGDKIKQQIGDNYGNISIRYCEQKEQKGTGHAILQAKQFLNGEKFIILYGDDIYSRKDIKNLLNNDYAILSKEVSNPENFGVLDIEDGHLSKIIEKPSNPSSNQINTGCYVLDNKIFEKDLELSSRGEYELIDYLNYLIDKNEKIKVETISGNWLPVNNFEELEIANEVLGKCVE